MMDPYISGREVYYVRVTKMGSSRWISGMFNGKEVRTIAIESIVGSSNIVIGNRYYYNVGDVGKLAPGTYTFKTQAMCNVTSRMFEASRNIQIK